MRDLAAFDDLFNSPDWFLADFDPDTASFSYVRTSETIIRQSAFLDGRTPLAVDDRVLSVPLDAALAWIGALESAETSDRFLAHISFCGSTLLGRLLQGNGAALGYSEPHVLAKFATLKAGQHAITKQRPNWLAMNRFALTQYRKSWSQPVTFIKPSNWVNTLLPDLSEASPDFKLAIIDTGIEDYLIANLRGGKARLSYSLNLLNHFLSANRTYRAQVLDVERAELEPTQRLLRLLILVYETQQRLLDQPLQAHAGQGVCRVTKADLQTDPAGTALKVADALDLTLTQDALEVAIHRDLPQHAKDPAQSFRPELEASENAKLRSELAPAFEAALTWAETALRRAA